MYKLTHESMMFISPVLEKIGFERVDRWLRWSEEVGKKAVFDCQMCGQCVLHSTGMTCPMTCPKNLRNGPCGGVRENGNCEVIPDMRCIWVEAFERSQDMAIYGHEMMNIQPPVNRRLQGSSAWVNMLSQEDKKVPAGWVGIKSISVIKNK
jgi:hypothetical protein